MQSLFFTEPGEAEPLENFKFSENTRNILEDFEPEKLKEFFHQPCQNVHLRKNLLILYAVLNPSINYSETIDIKTIQWSILGFMEDIG